MISNNDSQINYPSILGNKARESAYSARYNLIILAMLMGVGGSSSFKLFLGSFLFLILILARLSCFLKSVYYKNSRENKD